jgi:hypothetical protein
MVTWVMSPTCKTKHKKTNTKGKINKNVIASIGEKVED